MRLSWHVVHTKPNKEEYVRVLLEQNGLSVFLPRVLEWNKGRRRAGENVNILFPGYLFVRMSVQRDLAKVRWTPCVKNILGSDGDPAVVEGSLIEGLRETMGEKGYIVQRADFKNGEEVEVRRGPFAGLLGRVESPTVARERVRVLLTLFERRTTVELSTRDLARVGRRC